MLRKLRSRLSYANVMSTIAVFIVLGGSAYAAATLPKNSVGAKQIKANAVSSSKVKDGSLTVKDLKAADVTALKGVAGNGPTGPAGPAGPAGAAGAAGAKGDKGDKGDAGRSALSSLQSGESVKGGWIIDEQAPTTNGDFQTFIQFPIPAPTPLAADSSDVYVDGVTVGETCAGTLNNPTSPPGKVCVYVGTKVNVSGDVFAYTSTDTGTEGTRRGFGLGISNSATGDVYARGAWVYTAP